PVPLAASLSPILAEEEFLGPPEAAYEPSASTPRVHFHLQLRGQPCQQSDARQTGCISVEYPPRGCQAWIVSRRTASVCLRDQLHSALAQQENRILMAQ